MIKETLATLATFLIAISYLPQLIKGFKTKKLEDISAGFLILLFSASILWIIYAVIADDSIILTANIVIGIMVSSLMIMKFYYSRGNSS